ncbi:MAG: phage tail tape measure protein [Candidatus Competibacter denitrificans]
MPNLQSTIDLIFNGVDNASQVADRVGNSLGNLSSSAQSISAPFADLAGKLAVVQTGMTALAGVIGALAFNESAKFQASLATLQKQMDENEGGAARFGVELETLALKYGTNNNALVQSAADFKAAGYDIETSIKLVKSSMDLAIAGGVETAKAVDYMNRSLAGFQVPASDVVREAQHINDVLNKTADLTKSSFVELATGFTDLSPIAKQTGLTIEQTAAIISKVVDVFGSGSEAANGLKSGFLSLVDPSKEAATAMEAMGVHYKNADGKLKSVKDILAELSPAFGKLDESQRLAAASTIFGKDQAAKLVQVMLTYNDAMDLAAKLSREAGGSIEKEVAGKLALAETQVKRTDEAFRQLLQALGDKTLINAGGVIGSLGDLALAFRDVIRSGDLDPLFNALKAELGEIEKLFKTIAGNLPEAFKGVKFDGLLSAFSQLKDAGRLAMEALFGPVDLTTVKGLQDALQKVVDLIAGLTRVTAGELGGFAPFLKGIGALAKSFNDAEGSTQTFAGQLIGFGAMLNTAAGYFDGINTALLTFIAFGPKLAQFPTLIREIAAGLQLFAGSAAGFQLGIAGVAAGVGALSFEITRMTGMDKTLNDVLAPDALAGYKGATLGTLAADIAEKLGLIGPAADKAANGIAILPPAFQKETEAARETRNEINAWLDKQGSAAKVAGDTAKEMDALTASFQRQGYSYNAVTGELTKLKQSIAPFAEIKPIPDGIVTGAYLANIDGAISKHGVLVKSYEQIHGAATVKATGAFKAVGDAAKEQAKQLDEAVKKSESFKIEMEKLASNERIKTMEFAVNLKVEQFKADAERVKATFASIDTTIKSTGDLLGSLFGNLTSATDIHDKLNIERQIDLENKRRQEALDIQKRLAEAEILRVEAQTRALDRGDALLKIDGTGLEPEIRAFMFKIIKLLRVEMSSQFSNFLLGMGAT